MANDIRFNRTASIQQMQELLKQSQKTGANAQAQGTSFEEMLALKREAVREVKFSKHATERLDDRDITITDEQMQRLNNGVKQAETKGINYASSENKTILANIVQSAISGIAGRRV